MNPEFERNLWLELTPRRVLLMVAILGLIFAAAAMTGDVWAPSVVASSLYYLIVVVWGSRSAALSVTGEIRDRTWDGQRLSALGAGAMAVGKLFGATSYNWLGGAICLSLVLVDLAAHQGAAAAAINALYFIGIGIIAQAAALLASLIAIGRRQSHSRFEVFIYQMVGIVAALMIYYVWQAADPATALREHKPVTEFIPWWGTRIDTRVFLIVSVVVFAAWLLLGCYRAMRVELKMRNGPWVWLAFLVFIGLYVAGFDAWLSPNLKTWDAAGLRLMLAGTAFASLTYIMVLLEPKDRVHYRWMAGQFRAGHVANALSGLQAWMMSYGAALATTAVLTVWLMRDAGAARVGQPLVLATMGFITRDVALFVLMQTLPGKRRGDFGALAILFALYVLVPSILAGLHATGAYFLFFPQPDSASWAGVIAAWAQGAAVAGLAVTRLALRERDGRVVAA